MLTTARYYTPSGRSTQAQGIEPDAVVDEELPDGMIKPKTEAEADCLVTSGLRLRQT